MNYKEYNNVLFNIIHKISLLKILETLNILNTEIIKRILILCTEKSLKKLTSTKSFMSLTCLTRLLKSFTGCTHFNARSFSCIPRHPPGCFNQQFLNTPWPHREGGSNDEAPCDTGGGGGGGGNGLPVSLCLRLLRTVWAARRR